jgi:hypothetical protein
MDPPSAYCSVLEERHPGRGASHGFATRSERIRETRERGYAIRTDAIRGRQMKDLNVH